MRFAQPETTAAMRWADSSPAATVCSMTDFLLHVALTVFMISSRCACVWLLGCVLRRGLLQDEEGVLSGIGLTSVDECLSVVDPPLSWKWMCSGDAAWRYVVDRAFPAVFPRTLRPRTNSTIISTLGLTTLMNHRNVKKVFYPEGRVCTTTALCE